MLLLDPNRRPVIAHRGNRAHAPENTLEAFTQALALGADAIECDVHLSRDGVPMVLHDDTLDRTTDGRGPLREHTVAELARHDAGARFTVDGGRSFPYRGQGIRIPTLEEAVASLPPALPFILELKTVEVARPALALLDRLGVLGRVLVGSFLDDALLPFREAGVPTSPGARTLARGLLPALLGSRPGAPAHRALCIPRFHRGLPLPVAGFAAGMRAAGGPTHVWTINDPTVARRLWARGVSGIITDDPAPMLALRGAAA